MEAKRQSLVDKTDVSGGAETVSKVGVILCNQVQTENKTRRSSVLFEFGNFEDVMCEPHKSKEPEM